MRVGRAAWVLDAKEWRERYGQIGTQTAARDSMVSRLWSMSVTEAANVLPASEATSPNGQPAFDVDPIPERDP